MIAIQTSQGVVEINVPEEFSSVAVKLSGGADSALVLYLLARYSKIVRPLKICAVTVINEVKPFQHVYAARVIKFIEENLNVRITHYIKPDPVAPSEYAEKQNEYVKSLRKSGVFEINFSGITENPDDDLDPYENFTFAKERDKSQGVKLVRSNFGFTPLANVNKKAVAEIYSKYELMDTLFPITRSCESVDVMIDDKHCEDRCWWCLERMWGFGRLE